MPCNCFLWVQAMCQLDATSSTKLFFSWPLICKGQVWRLVTNFLYFGALDVHFLFHMYFLVSVDDTKKGLAGCSALLFKFYEVVVDSWARKVRWEVGRLSFVPVS